MGTSFWGINFWYGVIHRSRLKYFTFQNAVTLLSDDLV